MYSNTLLNWSVLITAGLFLLFLAYKVISSFMEYKKMKKELLPKMGQNLMQLSLSKGTYEDSINVLNHIITTQCAEKMTLIELNGEQSQDYIKELTTDLTIDVMSSLSPEFKRLLLFYVTEVYIVEYVSRISREMIVKSIPVNDSKMIRI